MPAEHARFSPSSADRIIHCPGSLLLGEGIPETESDAMREGTEAHAWAEYELLRAYGEPPEDLPVKGEFHSEEMEYCARDYAAYAMEKVSALKEECGDVLLLTEQRLLFTNWVSDAFGTSDCVILSGRKACLIDYKYGRGHIVDAEQNAQLQCYALGLLQTFGDLYDFDSISMCIFQPRREHVSEWTISVPDLIKWGVEVLQPAAVQAMNGTGEFHEGDWCWTCRAKYRCAKRAEANLELARLEFREANLLTDEEMEDVLDRADRIAEWAADVREFAFQQALGGKVWKDWKLVEGRSNRRYTDEAKAAEAVKAEGLDPYEHRILGITDMEKLLGKKRFSELLKPYVEKPKGKPTLVRSSDKRASITL
ncbi:MAG: DUF2800 domain-containing protein [Selenomonadaceae bacterium]|nr:DUF2800 domain-containing protein [Selenomonadaceae bacterium]